MMKNRGTSSSFMSYMSLSGKVDNKNEQSNKQ